MAELSFLRGYREQKLFNEELANAKLRRRLSELAVEHEPEDRQFQLASRAQTKKEWGYKNQAEEYARINNYTTFALNQLGMANNAQEYNTVIAKMQRDQGLPDKYAMPFVMDPNLQGAQFEAARKEKLTRLQSIQADAQKQMKEFEHDLSMQEIEARNKGQMALEEARTRGNLEELRLEKELGSSRFRGPEYAPSELGKMIQERSRYEPNSPEWNQYQRVIDSVASGLRDYSTPTIKDRLDVREAATNDYYARYGEVNSLGQTTGVKAGSPPLQEHIQKFERQFYGQKEGGPEEGGPEEGGEDFDISGITADNVQKVYDATQTDEERAAVAQALINAGKLEEAQAFQKIVKKNEKATEKSSKTTPKAGSEPEASNRTSSYRKEEKPQETKRLLDLGKRPGVGGRMM